MATTLEELQLVFGANFNPLNKAAKQSEKKVDSSFKKMRKSSKKFSSSIKKSRAAIGKLGKAFGPLIAAIGGAVSVMKIYQGVNESFDRKDSLGKTADKLGITTEALAALNLQAEKGGTTTANMEMSLQRMNRRLQEAAEGSGTASDRLKQMGLDAQTLVNLSPDESFALIAEEINKMGTAGEKTAAAFDIFGLSGANLLKTMESGAAGIKKAKEEAERFGTAISRLDAMEAEVVNDAFTDVKLAVQGIFNVLSKQLGPAFFAMAKVATEFAIAMRKNQESTTSFGDIAIAVVATVAQVIHGLVLAWESVKLAVLGVRVVFAEYLSLVVNSLTDVVSRIMGFGEILSGIMDDPLGAMTVAWLEIKKVAVQSVQAIIQALSDQLTAMGKVAGGRVGAGLEKAAASLNNVTTKLAITAEKARLEINKLGEGSEGLKKIEEGFKKVTAAFDPTKAKKTGIDYLDGVASGFEETSNELQTKFGEQLGTLAQTANIFGGKTAFSFVTGMKEVFDQEVGDALAALPDPDGGEGGGDPKGDERVIREKLVQDELKRLDKDRIDTERNNAVAQATFFKSSLQNRLSVASGILGNLASLMQGKSKKMFEVGKAAAIGQAIVDTWAAANKSMASLPFPVNIAAASATAAAGLVNVQNIRAQKFGGSSAGAAGGGGAGAVSAAASADTAPPPPVRQTNINVNLQGTNFGGNGVRGLISELNEATDDNVQLNSTLNGATT